MYACVCVCQVRGDGSGQRIGVPVDSVRRERQGSQRHHTPHDPHAEVTGEATGDEGGKQQRA